MLKKLNLIMMIALFTVSANGASYALDDFLEEEVVE